MRPLVTAVDISQAVKRDEKTLTVTGDTIITPAARDAARDHGISIIVAGSSGGADAPRQSGASIPGIDHEALVRLVQNVIASMGIGPKDEQVVKQVDPSGLCVVSGKSIGLNSARAGTARELFSAQECGTMKAGFLCLDSQPFVRETACEFIGYVVDGTVKCTVNHRESTARTGDVMYLPASAHITLLSAAKAKVFFVTCPANSRYTHH